MSEILTSIAQPMRYLIELDTPLVLKKNSGMLMEGDVEANTVVLEVFKTRNVPADLSGITFCLYFTRPDGNTLQPIAGTVKENTVQLTLTGGCYKYTGQYTMLVTMKKGEENRTVLKATGHMEGRNTENMIDPEGTFPTPEELLEMLNMLDEALQSANTATENATAAATRANNAAAGIETVTATATELEPNEEATAQVIKGESGMHFAFGIPRGEKGEKGEKGDAGTAENVTIDSVAGLREELNNKQPKGDYLPADGTAADASKLGGKLPEEYLAADGTAADANKLGGKLPEAYATKEDLGNIDVGQLKAEVSQLKVDKLDKSATAADSSKLGGKASDYYLYKRNLLDNSDFTHFIAQAGIGGAHGTQAYAGDRWMLVSGTVTGSENANGGGYNGIVLNGTIRQILETPPDVATSAVGMISGTAEISYADGAVEITSSGGTLSWAALYEGEYPAETLPPYVPNGYGAELAECQRYYQLFKDTGVTGLVFSGGSRLLLPVYPKIIMREIPTISIGSVVWIRGAGINEANIPSITVNGYSYNPYSPMYELVFDSNISIGALNICMFMLTYELCADL